MPLVPADKLQPLPIRTTLPERSPPPPAATDPHAPCSHPMLSLVSCPGLWGVGIGEAGVDRVGWRRMYVPPCCSHAPTCASAVVGLVARQQPGADLVNLWSWCMLQRPAVAAKAATRGELLLPEVERRTQRAMQVALLVLFAADHIGAWLVAARRPISARCSPSALQRAPRRFGHAGNALTSPVAGRRAVIAVHGPRRSVPTPR